MGDGVPAPAPPAPAPPAPAPEPESESTVPATETEDNPSGNCRPTETYARQPGMDTWCDTNCAVGNCPASHCICDESPEDPTQNDPPTQDPPTQEDPTQDPPTQEDPTQDPPTQEDPTQDDPVQDEIKGYYMLSWLDSSSGPAGTNNWVYFSGWNTVQSALDELEPSDLEAAGSAFKWFTIGGGNHNGILNASKLDEFDAKLDQISDFGGVMYDIEKVQGSSSTMNPRFAASFAAVKAKGMKVAITVSHTAPYDCDSPQDAVDFVEAFVQDSNVDIISPQLYTSGFEAAPDFSATGFCAAAGCGWNMYQNVRSGLLIAPSIVETSQYDAAKTHLKEHENIDTSGYFVWKQSNGGSRRLDIHI